MQPNVEIMIATAISTILAARVHPESAYTGPLSRMGIHPVHAGVTDLLDTVRVDALVAFLKTLTDKRYEPLLEDREKAAN